MATDEGSVTAASTDQDMGNELSQTEASRQSVGGEGKPGHFHKVFVDPGYSDLTLVNDTDKPRTPESGTQETQYILDTGDRSDGVANGTVDRPPDQSVSELDDKDYDLIEECEALMKESSKQLLQANRDSSVKPAATDPSEPNNDTNNIVNDAVTADAPPSEPNNETNNIVNDTVTADTDPSEPNNDTNNIVNDAGTADAPPSEPNNDNNSIINDTVTADTATYLSEPNNNSNNIVNDIVAATTQGIAVDEKDDGDLVDVAVNNNSELTKADEVVPVTDIDNKTVTDIDNKTTEEIKEDSASSADSSPAKVGSDTSVEKDEVDTNISKAKRKKNKKKADKLKEREIIESVQQELKELEGSHKEKKGGLLSMFKFSRKKKPVSETGPEGSHPGEKASTHDVNGTQVIQVAIDNADNEQTNGTIDLDTNAPTESNNKGTEIHTSTSTGDKNEVVVNGNGHEENDVVEYAVVNKRPKAADQDSDKGKTENNGEGTDAAKDNTELYINGDKTDEDFVYINERPIDIDGLNEVVEQKLKDSLQKKAEKDSSSERGSLPRSRKSSTIETGSPSRVGQIKKSESGKLKKKSWSFQIGGNRNKSKSVEGFTSDSSGTEGAVSMDPGSTEQAAEPKKTRWRLGKFSFRKSFGDFSSSTPNLNEAGQSSEGDASPAKTGMKEDPRKLKKIKQKKDKKKKENGGEKKSASLMNLIFGDNQPRSRRSIVDDDLNIQETDAFDGVTLSDLSHDEDDQVSKNPDGSKSTKTNGKKDKKKKPKRDKSQERKIDETKEEPTVDQLDKTEVETVVIKQETTAIEEVPEVGLVVLDSEPSPVAESVVSKPTEDIKQSEINTYVPGIVDNPLEDCPVEETVEKEVVQRVTAVMKQETAEMPQAMDHSVKQQEENTTPKAFDNLIYGDITDVLSNDKDDHEVIGESQPDTEENAESQVIMDSNETDAAEKRTSRIEIKLYSPQQSIIEDEETTGTYVTLTELAKADATVDKSEDIVDEVNKAEEDKTVEIDNSVEENTSLKCKDSESLNETESKDVLQECAGEVLKEVVEQSEASMSECCSKTDEEPPAPIVEEVITKSVKEDSHVAISFPEPSAERQSADTSEKGCEADLDTGNDVSDQAIQEDNDQQTDNTVTDDVDKTEPECESLPKDIDSVAVAPKAGTVIMKEIGVQVPDIHIPLNIEKEFGQAVTDAATLSVGTQATDTAVDRESEQVTTGTETISGSSGAFF